MVTFDIHTPKAETKTKELTGEIGQYLQSIHFLFSFNLKLASSYVGGVEKAKSQDEISLPPKSKSSHDNN